jgi:hypothetical protein
MTVFTRFATHLDLMRRMFARTGAANGLALADGLEGTMRQAMARCAGCRETDACKDYLANADGEELPGFCANVQLIDRLRHMAGEPAR